MCVCMCVLGDTLVPVADCDTKQYNSNPKQTMTFREFIQYWKENIQNHYTSPQGCLYLKDWHMTRWVSPCTHLSHSAVIDFRSTGLCGMAVLFFWLPSDLWSLCHCDSFPECSRSTMPMPRPSTSPLIGWMSTGTRWVWTTTASSTWDLKDPGERTSQLVGSQSYREHQALLSVSHGHCAVPPLSSRGCYCIFTKHPHSSRI